MSVSFSMPLAGAASFRQPGASTKGRTIADKLGEYVSAKDYGAVGDGTTDDTAAIEAAISEANTIFFPNGVYRTTRVIAVPSNRRLIGQSRDKAIVANDLSNGTLSKKAVFAVGNMHGAGLASFTSYACGATTTPTRTLTTTTPGAGANFTAGQLVVVGTATNVSGVLSYGLPNKILAVSGDVVLFKYPILYPLPDATIFVPATTDADIGLPYGLVENVTIESLGFRGRSPLSTKSGGINIRCEHLNVEACHIGPALNGGTDAVFDDVVGGYSGRMLEVALNSQSVRFKNVSLVFNPTSPTGEGQTFPINLGEQSVDITLDNVSCHLDANFTANLPLAQVKTRVTKILNSNWFHGGTQNQEVLQIASGSVAGHGPSDILFDGFRLGATSAHARLATIGTSGGATADPSCVTFRNGVLEGAVSSESIWFAAGSSFALINTEDKTGKTYKVSQAKAPYPILSGYRRAS